MTEYKSKICSKCGTEKEFGEFPKNERRCKKCRDDHFKIYKENNTESLRIYRQKYREINKEKLKSERDKYYECNKDQLKEKSKNFRIENKELINESKRIYYKKNRNKANEYIRRKLNNDALFKMSSNIRSLIRKSISESGYTKKSKTYEILGITFEEFREYMESKFESWMNWGNNGKYTGGYNETWQFDHIIPISLAKTEEDIIKLNHYTNFQPLCSKVNLEKSNNLDHEISC